MKRSLYMSSRYAWRLLGCWLLAACSDDAGGRQAGPDREHRLATPRAAGDEPNDPTPGAGGAPDAGSASGGSPPGAGAGCMRDRVVLSDRVVNARALGGLPLEAGGHVTCDALFRGPPLAGLSSEGCADVAALGVRTLIDLRTPDERSGRPNSSCLSATQVLAPLPIPYGLSPSDYLNDLNSPSIALAFRAFGDAGAYPIYFHCTFGRDRTGVVGALLLLALGVSREHVMQEYLLSQATVGAYPESLNAVLDEIERRGGAERFLREAGISEDELSVLKAHVTLPD